MKKTLGRWLYVAVGVVIMLMFGMIYAWSVFVLPLEKEFGWSRDQTSMTFSLTLIFFSIGIMLGGILTDRRGPRLVSAVAGSVMAGGLIAASFTQSLMHLYLSYGVVCGLSVGIAYNCVISTVVRWFPDYRGVVSGVLMMGFGFGGLLLGVGASRLIAVMGWRVAFQVFGCAAFVLVVILGRLLRPWGPTESEVSAAADGAASTPEGPHYGWRETLAEPSFWMLWFWQLSVISGGLATIGHIVPLAVEKGFAAGEAAAALGVLSISNGIGRVSFGALSDRFGKKWVMLADSLLMLLAMLLFAGLSPAWGDAGLLLCVICAGLGYGGSMPQVAAAIAAFFGQRHFGANFGLVSTGIVGAALVGPYLSGMVKTLTGSYSLGFVFLAGLAASGMIVSQCLRAPSMKAPGTVR